MSSPSLYSDITLIDLLNLPTPIEVTLFRAPSDVISSEAEINQVKNSRFFLAFPLPKEAEAWPQEGQPIHIRFGRTGGEVVEVSTVITLVDSDYQSGCWVAVPPKFKEELFKRRKHIRIPMHFPVRIIPANRAPEVTAHTINLSGGGMRLVSTKPFLKGEQLTLVFRPGPQDPEFRLLAEVVFQKFNDETVLSSRRNWIVGLRFKDLTRIEEDRLVGICFRKELGQRHLQEE